MAKLIIGRINFKSGDHVNSVAFSAVDGEIYLDFEGRNPGKIKGYFRYTTKRGEKGHSSPPERFKRSEMEKIAEKYSGVFEFL